jgi:BirA family transcriptional regulator, biotin operon repressor / biotin---[acetyl-CoA-carboxylase] ligase
MSPSAPQRPDAALTALTRQAEGLWQAVSPLLPLFSVEILPSIDSTNTELMRRAREGQTTPTLLVALEQTAGRGRRGKHWVSRPGASLTFSLGLPLNPQDWSGLSLAVGASLADSLHPDVRLKWPNDLWCHGQKLGGILVETASLGPQRYAVVGVGLNVETPTLPPATPHPNPSDVAPLPAVPPIGLQDLPHAASQRDAGQWLAHVVPALVRDLLLFERQGFAAFAERFDRRDALKGRALRLSDGQEGQGLGVAADGALRLHTAQGVVSVTSAEVSVRPC